MMNERLSRAADYIKAHQNSDGGWGYEPGRTSLVEPTGSPSPSTPAASAAVAGRLRVSQKMPKSLGSHRHQPRGRRRELDGLRALLAFHGLGASDEEGSSGNGSWPSRTPRAVSPGRHRGDLRASATTLRSRAGRGHPGRPAWVEPTALFILALVRSGVPPAAKRIRSGIELILDRKVPSGGWNFGNPYSQTFELEATAMSTALALAALGAAGFPESRPAVGGGIRISARAWPVRSARPPWPGPCSP